MVHIQIAKHIRNEAPYALELGRTDLRALKGLGKHWAVGRELAEILDNYISRAEEIWRMG